MSHHRPANQTPMHRGDPLLRVTYGLVDADLADAIERPAASIAILRRAFRFIVVTHSGDRYHGYSGELGKQTQAVLRDCANRGVLSFTEWPDSLSDRPVALEASLIRAGSPLSGAEVDEWCRARDQLLQLGRGPSLKASSKEQVLRDAANACMFRGCGKRVDKIAGTARHGNVGQLAHIVGADPNGPRGRDDSHALAGQASNVMLVCYDHHRLIDAIDPEGHTIAILQEMRRFHVTKVDRLLRQLAWPSVRPLIIRGGIAGQNPAITPREIDDALEGVCLSASPPDGEFFNMAPIERAETGYGNHVLTQLRPAIARFVTVFQAGRYGPSEDDIAVFALHDTPVLVLAGRIVGEARNVHVFQRDRAQGTWCWADPTKIISDVALDVELKVRAIDPSPSGLLTIALSDRFQEGWIPEEMRQDILAGNTTWLSLGARQPGIGVVGAPCDLAHIMATIRDAMRQLQGDFEVTRLALIIVAPVSVAFSIGQALQAGNHIPVTVFHRTDSSGPFEPAIRITARSVESADPQSQHAPTVIALQ